MAKSSKSITVPLGSVSLLVQLHFAIILPLIPCILHAFSSANVLGWAELAKFTFVLSVCHVWVVIHVYVYSRENNVWG